MLLLIFIFLTSLSAAEPSTYYPYLHKGNVILPALTSSYIKTIMTDQDAKKERLNHFYRLLHDTSYPHYKLNAAIFSPENTAITIQALLQLAREGFLKESSTLTILNHQNVFYPTADFNSSCPIGSKCLFANQEFRERFQRLWATKTYEVLESSKKSSGVIHLFLFASGSLEIEARGLLNLFEHISRNQKELSSTIVVHCIDPVYNESKTAQSSSSSYGLLDVLSLQNSFRTLLKEAKNESGIFPCKNLKIKGLVWHPSVTALIQHFNKQEHANPELYKDPKIVASTFDSDSIQALVATKAPQDFINLLESFSIEIVVAALRQYNTSDLHHKALFSTDRQEITNTLLDSIKAHS